jgi:hypothetical protein
MATVTLVLGESTFPVASQALRQACGLFGGESALSHCHVQSRVPLSHFWLFFEPVQGNEIQMTNENVSGLSQLCDEFGFRSLSSKLSAFRDSAGLPLVSAAAPSEVQVSDCISVPFSPLRSAIPCQTFTLLINGKHMASNVVEAVILSPAVHERLLVDSCAKTFVV